MLFFIVFYKKIFQVYLVLMKLMEVEISVKIPLFNNTSIFIKGKDSVLTILFFTTTSNNIFNFHVIKTFPVVCYIRAPVN